MAIVTDQTITIHGVQVGISKPIMQLISTGDFTYEELSKFAFVGRHDFINDFIGIYESELQETGSASSLLAKNKYPAMNDPAGAWSNIKYLYTGKGERPYDAYGKMVLVYNRTASASAIQNNYSDSNSSCIVTEINPRLLKMIPNITHSTVTATYGEPGTYDVYDAEASISIKWYDDNSTAPFSTLCVQKYDTYEYFTFPLYDNRATSTEVISGNTGSTKARMYYMNDAFNRPGNKYISPWAQTDDIDDFASGASYSSTWNCVNKVNTDRANRNLILKYRGSPYYEGTVYVKAADLDAILKQCAGCGLYFEYNSTIYKPVVEGGIVTGYTDDLMHNSEWDLINDVTGNTIPDTPTPGPGPGPGPYDDDPWSGATFAGTGVGGAGAFAKCYYMTSTELANLRSWMNSINVPEGFDPMQQIIGLSQVPVALSGSGPENVVFVNSSAVYDPGVTTRAVDTGVATQQAMGTPISYYLGSVDIVRRMQERGEPYLDYDCQIELYLPLIGMFSLDTQAVMGRTISAYAVLDPVSGTLAAYAYVSKGGQNLPIAYGSTTIGVDLPISAQQLSVSRAALKQANAQLGASLLSGALTMLAAASSGGKSSGSGAKTSTGSSGLSAAGIREAGSDYMKASQVGNVFGDFMNWGRTIRQLSYGNNTAVAGSFGGSTAQWSYPFTPYVKIIRPRYEKPSNYAHSQGVPCVQTKTIGSCTGFIQCIGVDVSGITGATDLELQAIQAALSNGIYAGGGQ